MEQQKISPVHWRISRAEMLYLLNALSAKNLIGVDQHILQAELDSSRGKNNHGEIENTLAAKKILVPDKQQGHIISEEIRPVLDVLFFPQRALFATRHRKGEGRQVICAGQKNQMIVVHSFPGKGEHSIRVVPAPDNLFELLVNWYPFFRLPISPARMDIPEDLYKRIRAVASSGKPEEGLALMGTVALDPEDKRNFIQCLGDCRMSGTMAWMQISESKIEKADSFSVVSDGRTGWLISQDNPPASNSTIFNIRRTGADLAMTIRTYVERLSDAKLPRLQTDPSGKFKRFTLTADELTMALNAINCTDIASKLYVETSKDEHLESYSERMKKAQQSLTDTGLCTLSEKSIPVIHEDLSRAVFSLAHADWQIQITASGGSPIMDMGMYIARGQFFSAYYNYGEYLQVIEYGKHEDAGIFLESLFPDFCVKKSDPKLDSTLSFAALDKIKIIGANRQEAERILLADGLADMPARTLAQDLSDSFFRATIVRNNPPHTGKGNAGVSQDAPGQNLVLLLKSPRNSWLVQFHDVNARGKAVFADRDIFRRALVEMII
jgi:hypothetical protein